MGLTWANETRKLRDLQPQEDNPRQIRKAQAERLVKSFDQFNQVETIACNPDGTILNGHQRYFVLLAAYDADYEVDVRIPSRPLSRAEWQKLTVYLHKGAAGEWNWDALAEWEGVDVEDLLDWGFSEEELVGVWPDDDPPDDLDVLTSADVPDALWPSNNEWGIPLLDASLQAIAVDLPVSLWGAAGRKKRMDGTWVFYCDDYRFEALWKDPSTVVNTQCVNAVEPNFTVGPQTPRAVALWQIYRKRYIARWWQSCGVRVLVDMNVDFSTFGDIALLGVPEGWKAYATRGYTERRDYTILEYEAACEHAGTDSILFLLYGGGKKCQELAQERGWIWIPEHMDVKRGGKVKDG